MGLKVRIDILTLFPRFFDGVLSESILDRAAQFGKVEYQVHNLRDYSTDPHHKADDYIYGGSAGMLLKPDPLWKALKHLTDQATSRPTVIFTSPHGKQFVQQDAVELSRMYHLIYICGHYKGIDQRVIERWVDRQYSIGNYVVTGGEIAVAVMIDASVRLLPGVLGDFDSARTDSFSNGGFDSPHYTRPEEIEGNSVPSVLLSGHEANIKRWRQIASELIRIRSEAEPKKLVKLWNK